jgi:hypothetical protein
MDSVSVHTLRENLELADDISRVKDFITKKRLLDHITHQMQQLLISSPLPTLPNHLWLSHERKSEIGVGTYSASISLIPC